MDAAVQQRTCTESTCPEIQHADHTDVSTFPTVVLSRRYTLPMLHDIVELCLITDKAFALQEAVIQTVLRCDDAVSSISSSCVDSVRIWQCTAFCFSMFTTTLPAYFVLDPRFLNFINTYMLLILADLGFRRCKAQLCKI